MQYKKTERIAVRKEASCLGYSLCASMADIRTFRSPWHAHDEAARPAAASNGDPALGHWSRGGVNMSVCAVYVTSLFLYHYLQYFYYYAASSMPWSHK